MFINENFTVPNLGTCPMHLKSGSLHKCRELLYKYLLNYFGFDFAALVGVDKLYNFSASHYSNTLGMEKQSKRQESCSFSVTLEYLLCWREHIILKVSNGPAHVEPTKAIPTLQPLSLTFSLSLPLSGLQEHCS